MKLCNPANTAMGFLFASVTKATVNKVVTVSNKTSSIKISVVYIMLNKIVECKKKK